MAPIHIDVTLPVVFSYLPLILAVYASVGALAWFAQSIWIYSHSTYGESFLKASKLPLLGFMIAWPMFLLHQFRVKVLGETLEKVMHFAKSDAYENNDESIQKSVKVIRGGEKIRLTYGKGRVFGTEPVIAEDVAKRKYSSLNCSQIIFSHNILRDYNGRATNLAGAPVEVLV